MNREAVILTGGFGTRLKSVVQDVPKPMALIHGIPFLSYLLDQLSGYEFRKAVIAAGYKSDVIESFYGSSYKGVELVYSVEDKPLGTGGAIALASEKTESENFFVLNGDTLFMVDFSKMEKRFHQDKSVLSVALKEMIHFDRYGVVRTIGSKIISFEEKRFCKKGLINGGIYLINKSWFRGRVEDKVFSFEKDMLEKRAGIDQITYYISDGYFIDIGVPEDYARAEKELPVINPPTPL